jgi:hypothetical protein
MRWKVAEPLTVVRAVNCVGCLLFLLAVVCGPFWWYRRAHDAWCQGLLDQIVRGGLPGDGRILSRERDIDGNKGGGDCYICSVRVFIAVRATDDQVRAFYRDQTWRPGKKPLNLKLTSVGALPGNTFEPTPSVGGPAPYRVWLIQITDGDGSTGLDTRCW